MSTKTIEQVLTINVDQDMKVFLQEFLDQALAQHKASTAVAKCSKDLADLQAELKQTKASVGVAFRKAATDKVTDKSVEQHVDDHEDVVRLKSAIIEKDFELDMLKADAEALRQKCEMLRCIVDSTKKR